MTDLGDLAQDYVLGLLSEPGMAEVERRLNAPQTPEDRELASTVGAVRDHFFPLDLTAPEVPPSPAVWERISAALSAPPPIARAEISTARHSSRVTPWRATALGAIAASLVLAILLTWRVMVVETPTVVAVLVDQRGEAVAIVEAFVDDSVRISPLRVVDAAPTQVLQLWTKPDPDGPPESLGLLESLQRTRVTGPDLPDPSQGQLYEITIEPAGGSPTGLPTGPILGKGLAFKTL